MVCDFCLWRWFVLISHESDCWLHLKTILYMVDFSEQLDRAWAPLHVVNTVAFYIRADTLLILILLNCALSLHVSDLCWHSQPYFNWGWGLLWHAMNPAPVELSHSARRHMEPSFSANLQHKLRSSDPNVMMNIYKF